MIDLNILKAMSDRRRYKNLRQAVPEQMLSPETIGMLRWFEVYWSAYPESNTLCPEELISMIRLRSKGASAEQLGLTIGLAEKLKKPVSEETLRGITAQLYELDFAGQAGSVLARYNDAQDCDVTYELMMLATNARKAISEGEKPSWCDTPIMELLEGDSDEGGITLDFIPELARNIKGLQPGDNIAVVAPTDKGKTSFLLRAVDSAAKQGKVQYPGRPLLYLVNEGKATKIKNRLYQTLCGLSRADMITLERENPGSLDALFRDAYGSLDAIRIVEIHGKHMGHVTRIIEQHEPYGVFTDMTGRIRALSNKTGGANDISQLEEVWDGMRELGAIYNFWHCGTVQVSAEGFGMLYPPLSAMQNSKTGIQTTLDLAIVMGALNNPDAVNLRGISTPKNKLARSGCPSLLQFQVSFDPEPNVWS